jgi:hypothetical protein
MKWEPARPSLRLHRAPLKSAAGLAGLSEEHQAVAAPVRTDDLEERSASIIRVTRIGDLETTLTVTSNWSTL